MLKYQRSSNFKSVLQTTQFPLFLFLLLSHKKTNHISLTNNIGKIYNRKICIKCPFSLTHAYTHSNKRLFFLQKPRHQTTKKMNHIVIIYLPNTPHLLHTHILLQQYNVYIHQQNVDRKFVRYVLPLCTDSLLTVKSDGGAIH